MFRFFILPSDFGPMLWKVPVTVATKDKPDSSRFVLEKQSDVVTLEGVEPENYVLVSGSFY